jgi:hypothetical protein
MATLSHDRQREIALNYMLDIAKVLHKHKDKLAQIDQHMWLKIGVRPDEVIGTVRGLRAGRQPFQPKGNDYEFRARSGAAQYIVEKFDMKKGGVFTSTGSPVRGYREKRNGVYEHSIRVGYMFNKRCRPLMKGLDIGEKVILSATEVRVNDRRVRLYECRTYAKDGENRVEYLAVYKQDPTIKALSGKVSGAIKSLNDLIAKQVDNMLG